MNIRAVLGFLGRLLLFVALAEVIPTFWCLWYGERRAALAFLIGAAVTALVGFGLKTASRRGGELYRREGILIVVGGWFLASVMGAVPYVLSGAIPSPVDALFESASGFTTTGASILVDIEAAGRGVLFWRSFTQWLGGMGIIVLFVALLTELGPGARLLYQLEVPGPTAEILHARVQSTAMVLWKIYLALSAAEMIFLLLAGLDLYDAMTHTFSTLSTGGFSPYGASVAAFDSPLVECIVLVFMVIAGVNFSLYYVIFRRRQWGLLRDPEMRLYLGTIIVAAAVVAVVLLRSSDSESVSRSVLDAAFQVASIVTTTGFATANFDLWPEQARLILLGLMFVGGSAGSTAGGIKILRILVGLKAALREVRLIFSPNAVIALVIGGKPVGDTAVRSVVGFLVLYFGIFVAGAFLLSFGDVSLMTAVTASIANLGNIGPGLDAVGPSANYAAFADWQKLVMVLLMWLGRLEVYAVVALLTVAFWRD